MLAIPRALEDGNIAAEERAGARKLSRPPVQFLLVFVIGFTGLDREELAVAEPGKARQGKRAQRDVSGMLGGREDALSDPGNPRDISGNRCCRQSPVVLWRLHRLVY